MARKREPSPEVRRLLEEAAKDYAAHQAALADGSAQTGETIARLAAQRAANRQWSKAPQPSGDDDNPVPTE